MPRERRQIILSNDELVGAIDRYRRRHPDVLPLGKILDCTVEDDRSVVARIELASVQSTHAVEVRFKGAEMIEALIHFCIENKIRLPRAGIKSLAVIDGDIALCVRLSQSVELEEAMPVRLRLV
jgi:hypothetical protein